MVGVVGGIVIVIITYATRPANNLIGIASNMASILDVDIATVDTTGWVDPEVAKRTPITGADVGAVGFGLLSGLLALHAMAVVRVPAAR